MIYPAAIAVYLLDTVSQAPVVVQCPPATPETWVKWLLPTIVQTVVSLLSIAAGVLIAVWSFRKNRQSDHERWILDQKKAEWNAIVSGLTVVDIKLPHVFMAKEWPTSSDEILLGVRNILPTLRNALFIADVLKKKEIITSFTSFVSEAAEKVEQISGLTSMVNNPLPPSSVEHQARINLERIGAMNKRTSVYGEIFDAFHIQADKIREIALENLTSPL